MSIAKFGYWLFIAALFGNVVVWAFIPSLAMYWSSYLVLLALALVGFGLWVFFSLNRFMAWLKLRSTQFGLSLFVMAIMTAVILGVVNWVAVSKNVKTDLTAHKLHTLSEQTQAVVKNLDEEVRIRVWTIDLGQMSQGVDMRGFFDNYAQIGGDKLKIEIRNPNEFSADAEADQVRRNNIVVVKAMKSGREARIESFSDTKAEEQLTNAIIQATKGRKKVVCFVSGHGQPSLENHEAPGLSQLKEALEKSNYEARELVLVNSEAVPADCELLANVGPRNAPLEREQAMIKKHLEAGHSMIALIGPRAPKEWRDFFRAYGVQVRQDLVIDPKRQDNPAFVGTNNYARDVHVTEGFSLATIYPESSSIQVSTEASSDDSLSVKPFVSTDATAYAKAGAIPQIKNMLRASGDLRGPLPLAVLIEKSLAAPAATPATPAKPATPPAEHGAQSLHRLLDAVVPSAQAQPATDASEVPDPMGEEQQEEKHEKKERVILFGNDLFVVNGFIGALGNSDIFMNSVNYLLSDQELMGIRPRDLRQTYLRLTYQDIRKVWGFILIVAGLFVVFGVKAARRKAVTA
jgi:ABC-type uncharacterized transport system involved in gliding motility auxiliary subunit